MKNFIVFMAFLILGISIAGIVYEYKQDATAMKEKSKTAITEIQDKI